MAALIGIGAVWHRRLRPVAHDFRYPSCFLLLPLRQLRHQPEAALAHNRFGLLSFFDRDHGDGSGDALAWVERTLAAEGIDDADGEIWLQTYPRVLGHVFKPVSFWYCERRDGTLAAVLAEVNNTFGERHVYLLDGAAWGKEQRARKVLHVSPFCRVDGHYRFRFERSAAHLRACVDHEDSEGPLLRTSIHGALEPLARRRPWRQRVALAWWVLAVIAHIHLQALRLWRKRLPFFTKPQAPARFLTRGS